MFLSFSVLDNFFCLNFFFVFVYSWSTLLWYRCYYPHRSRDALSPVCGIFCLEILKAVCLSFDSVPKLIKKSLRKGSIKKKSSIRETKNLSTDADSSTDTTVGWTKNTQKPNFFQNGKNHPKRKNSKTFRNMPKLAICPSTRGL